MTKKERPMVVIWGIANVQGLPWVRHATDADLERRGEDPDEYVPRDESKDRWGI